MIRQQQCIISTAGNIPPFYTYCLKVICHFCTYSRSQPDLDATTGGGVCYYYSTFGTLDIYDRKRVACISAVVMVS